MATANMGLTLPTVGGSTGTWGTTTNDNEEIIDAHTHEPGKGLPVPTAGLEIDADLTFAGSAAINLKGAGFTAQGSAPSILRCCWVDTSGDLYYRNAAGTSVQITSGGQLDVSSVGGITGDYASVGASFYYDDANKTYRALRTSPLPNFWASVSMGDLDLYEKASGISNRIRIKSPAALAASYDWTLPTAVPGAAAILVSSTAGVLSYNSSSNRAPVGATTLDVNGAAAFTNTVALGTSVAAFTSTGVITATDFKHTTGRVQQMTALHVGYKAAGIDFNPTTDFSTIYLAAVATDPGLGFPIRLDQGMRITQIVVRAIKTSPAGTLTARFVQYNNPTAVKTAVATASNAAVSPGEIALTMSGLTTTITADRSYWVEIKGGGTNGDGIHGIEITYDRP